MEPLEMLRNEHGLIRQYVDHLADAADKIKNDQKPPREFFEKAAQFSREFTEQYHHVKEEYMMFVRLAMKKGGEMDGEIESLRHQHEMGKNYISTIRGCVDAYAEGDPARTKDILEALGAYIAMERQHIHKEDHVFFPLVEQEFSETDMNQVKAEFEKARDKSGDDVFERNHKLVTEMGSVLQHM
jgi:hemerythrin-like domain-containing protein